MILEASSFNSNLPVLVIGSAGVDVIGQLKGDLQPGSSIPSHIRFSYGGAARNVAENLARLGQNVILITAIGQDKAGDQLLQQAQSAGINVDYVLQIPQHPTGAYIAVLNSAGKLEHAMDDMRVIAALTKNYIQKQADLFKQASFVFLDANLPKETIRTAVRLAKRAGLMICADPTSSVLAPRLFPYLADLFMVTPNRVEAAIFCGLPKPIRGHRIALASARNLVSLGVEVAIVTMAKSGLCYATSETNGYIPAIRTDVLDPTGAGAALTSAVILGLLNDIPLDDAIRLGVSAASLTLRCQGTVVPDLSLEKLYDQLVI
jgi:pseudouridine kinase